MFDILVVGSGLSGSVAARYFAELGKKVLIWERRNHIAGNLYDYRDENGILVQKYGPHIFHTNSNLVNNYITKYSVWKEFNLECMAEIDGKFTPTPFNFKTIDDFYNKEEAENIKKRMKVVFGGRNTITIVEALENSDELIRKFANFLFEKDYRLYTAKQWGIPPSEIDPSVLKRVPLKLSYDVGYFEDKYQMMPEHSFTKFIESILKHKNIKVLLNIEALDKLSVSEDGKNLLVEEKEVEYPVIYTGALDELFKCSLGELPYRSLKFDWRYENRDSIQDAPVVAYPQAAEFTRITEYKKLPVQDVKGTSYAIEYPIKYVRETGCEPYYPVLTKESKNQYKIYKEKAENIKNFFFCGRLADFQYYNMDQIIIRALNLCKEMENSIS